MLFSVFRIRVQLLNADVQMKSNYMTFLVVALFLAFNPLIQKAPNYKDIYVKPIRPSNILLFTIDTLRADHLGCYGYERINTPNINRLADEGILFEYTMSQIPLTTPSHSSIFTSLYPRNHGVLNNAQHLDGSLLTLTEILKENGYATAGFISCFVLQSKYGISQGFDAYFDQVEIKTKENPNRISYINSKQLNERIIPWLREHSQEKFFAWIHYFDPHNPYESHEKDGISYDSDFDPHPYGTSKPAKVLQDIAHYDAEITFADRSVGEIIDLLDELNLTEDTIVILTSDHGEELYQHHQIMGHAFFLYDSSIRIPLIIRYPNRFPASKRIDQLVESVDIMPTLLELLNIQIPDGIDGESLLAVIDKDKKISRVAYSETYKPEGRSNKFAVRTNRWKYIYTPERNARELYDIVDDPMELRNLAYEKREVVKELHKNFFDWLKMDSKPASRELDEETRERLKSLGYVN